jgi:hypothetical protein
MGRLPHFNQYMQATLRAHLPHVGEHHASDHVQLVVVFAGLDLHAGTGDRACLCDAERREDHRGIVIKAQAGGAIKQV